MSKLLLRVYLTRRSMMEKALSPAGLILAAAVLTGCLFGDSSDDPADPGEIAHAIPYTYKGDTLITLGYLGPYAYCIGDVLHTETDTMDADTVVFRITGSILTISTDLDTLKSGAVIEQVLVFERQGSGTGLEGLWSNTREELRVLSGTPSEKENAELEVGRKDRDGRRAYKRSWARFANGILTFFQDVDYAKRFISEWNNGIPGGFTADSGLYAIALKELDKNTVELKGLKSGETVRLAISSQGYTYTSNLPGHNPHRYREMPTTCPNEEKPAWYFLFLSLNSKPSTPGVEKTAEIHPKSGPSGIFPSAL